MGFLKKLFGQPKQAPPAPAPTPRRRERSYPSFPEGENHVDDPDVKTLADLEHYYRLPQGYEYRVRPDGSPYVFRPADSMEFKVVVEAGMLTIDEPFTRPDGRTGYHTTEVIKAGT
ncbi:MAG: hypothetical protein RBT75_04920 [Anaerolineae bacterium]|jgi:hypothetical protein|nr:hypothetical protein [Anaerolineae bacterium]